MKEKNNSKKVLYITFIDFEAESGTGSSVRPKRMYDAFIELGYEVKLLSGAMNNRKARQDGVKQIMDYLKYDRPDFCYIEPATGPMFFSCDRKLIKKIKQLDIPIAYFYRDIYWKFDMAKFANTYNIVTKVKSVIIRCMQKREFSMLKRCVTRFYLPSDSMIKYMDLDNATSLPPGCVEVCERREAGEKFRGIYVGGATERYGIGLLIDSWLKIPYDAELIIVCPEEQWLDWCEKFPQYTKLPTNISVHHLSEGEKLNELYQQCNFALIPILKTKYNDMVIPIKLYEYVSRDLPIVVTNCDEMERIIEKYNIGNVACDNIDSYSEAIVDIIQKLEKDVLHFQSNICNMKKCNMWTDRVKLVEKEILD